MNDKNLDDLFREAAERYQKNPKSTNPSHKEEVWNNIQQELNIPSQSSKRRWKYLFFLIPVFFGLLVWQIFGKRFNHSISPQLSKTRVIQQYNTITPTEQHTKEDEKGSLRLQPIPKAPKNVAAIQKKSHILTACNNPNRYVIQHVRKLNKIYSNNANDLITKNVPNSFPGHVKIPNSYQSTPTPILQQKQVNISFGNINSDSISNTELNIPTQKIIHYESPDHITGVVKESKSDVSIISQTTPPAKEDIYNKHAIAKHRINQQDLSFSETNNNKIKEDTNIQKKTSIVKGTANIKDTMAVHKKSNWSVGIAFGPAWSSIAAREWGLGIGGGVTISYAVSSQWAIGTGVMIDKMIYNARPSDYNPDDNWWKYYNVQSINARCTIIDIPLNVQYSFLSHKQHDFYIGAGISSFLMNTESYTYNYEQPNGRMASWTENMHNQEHHVLSIINIAPGYEHSWRSFMIGISPYMKIPLTGIGYGKVKLYATGINFTIKY